MGLTLADRRVGHTPLMLIGVLAATRRGATWKVAPRQAAESN